MQQSFIWWKCLKAREKWKKFPFLTSNLSTYMSLLQVFKALNYTTNLSLYPRMAATTMTIVINVLTSCFIKYKSFYEKEPHTKSVICSYFNNKQILKYALKQFLHIHESQYLNHFEIGFQKKKSQWRQRAAKFILTINSCDCLSIVI